MSHDETRGPVTRKERRAAYGGGRKSAPRRVFSADDYIRTDFTTARLIEFLEAKARGYNGHLRSLLCTAATMLRDQNAALRRYEEAASRFRIPELDEVASSTRVQGDRVETVDCSALMPVGVEDDGS